MRVLQIDRYCILCVVGSLCCIFIHTCSSALRIYILILVTISALFYSSVLDFKVLGNQ